MTDETNNTASDEDVTDNVKLSEDDTSEDYDFYDPDEDQDTVEAEETEGTDDEADEVEAEDEAEDQEAEDQPEKDPDTVTVTMADGAEVSLGELKKGYLRQDDYTRKTQDYSNRKARVEADVQRMEAITTQFVERISQFVPPAPDPALAMTDTNAYTVQKANHEAAMDQVKSLMEVQDAVKEVGGGMSEADKRTAAIEANQKLVEMFPEAASGKSREQFFGNVAATATDLGFTADELSNVRDHRIFALAHYAKIGRDHLESKTKAKAKVAKAPPAAPRKPGQGAGKKSGNAEAVRKFQKTGSLRDAAKIDFE